jgi:mercuric ion transport protein
MDQNTKLIGTGVAGVLLSVLCCLTPALMLLFGALGISAYVSKTGYVLVPVFVASFALIIVAIVRKRRSCAPQTPPT